MNEIRRNRRLLVILAAAAVAVGLVLGGAMPRGPAPAPSEAGGTVGGPVMDKSQPDQFAVRDYAEFGSSAGTDLPSMDWLGLLAGMGIKLAFVIGLIYAAIWALRRYVYRGRSTLSDKRPVSILGSLNLSPNRTVYVLSVGRKVIVVGATQNQLSTLTEITDPEALEELHEQAVDLPITDQFSSLFKTARDKLERHDIPPVDKIIADTAQLKVREGRQFMQGKLAEMRQSLGHG